MDAQATPSFLHRNHIFLKLHYFLYFSSFGMIIPILSITLRSRGMSNTELSYINTIIPFIVFFTNPLCGFIADRSRRYKLTFNLILGAVLILFGTLFLLPKIQAEKIHGKLIAGPMLEFCASQEMATKCASRSVCGCEYHANCVYSTADDRIQHVQFNFLMNDKKQIYKHVDAIDGVGQATCGVEYHVPISEASNLNSTPLDRITGCEITCSESNLCRGARYPSQLSFILIYSLLFILGNILFANAITVGASLGFASLPDPATFGQQRLWGTIGFGLSAFGASRVFGYFQSEFVYIIMFTIASGLCIIVTCFIRIQPKKVAPKDPEQNGDAEKTNTGVSALIPLLKKLDVLIFLSLTFLWGTSYAVLEPYLFMYLDEFAPCESRSIIGYMSIVSATAELIALFLAGKILNFVGTNISSLLILVAFGIRFGGYYLLRRAIFYTFMESMHFFNFGILLVLIVKEANEMAPPGLSATLQGVALGVCFGLGRGVGLLISSVIYNFVAQRTLFSTFSLVNFSAALLFGLYFLVDSRRKASSKKKNTVTLDLDKNRNEQPLLVQT